MENPFFVVIVAAGTAILVGLIATFGVYALRRNAAEAAYQEQLSDLMDDFDEDNAAPNTNLMTRWNELWNTHARDMGLTRYSGGNTTAGRDVIVAALLVFLLMFVFSRNPIVAVLVALGSVYALHVAFKNLASRKGEKLNQQLPGFIFALKANVQANETPENALVKVVDTMPSPLQEDLLVAKNRIMASSTFVEALQEMGAKTSSRDLKFLAACMIQASDTGASLESQLDTIQGVLEARRRTVQEREAAVRTVMPSIWISTIVIPASFLGSYILSPEARDFWFHGIISWIVFGVVIALYVIGMWLSKALVDSVKNL